MKFNPSKCNIMSIARSRSPFTYLYSLCGQVLSSVPEARYLGIMVTDELSWSSHVQSIYSKANFLLSVSSVAMCDATMPCQTQGVCLYFTCSLHIGICHIGMGSSPGEGHQVRILTYRGDRQDLLKVTIARLPVSRICCRSSAGRICRAVVGI